MDRGIPDGTILKFNCNNGLVKGFPYINMDNLKDHVFKPSSVAGNTLEPISSPVDLGTKVQALRELLKRKAFAFVQTVHENMESFNNHKVKMANLAHIAQKNGLSNQ